MGELHVVARPGAGPPVVLVHGSLDRGATFARVAGAEVLRGHAVVRYDRRGYGRSPLGPAGGAGLQDHVGDLLGLLGELDAGPAVLVGHSFGGLVGLAVATRAPERVVAVGAFEAPMPWLPWWPATTAGGSAVRAASAPGGDPEAAAEAFLTRMIGADRWAGLPERTRATRRREGTALVAELASVRPAGPGAAPPVDLAAVPVPVLASRGTRSPAHLQRAAAELATVTGTEVVVIDGADHGAHLTHADEVARRFVLPLVRLADGGAPPRRVDAAG